MEKTLRTHLFYKHNPKPDRQNGEFTHSLRYAVFTGRSVDRHEIDYMTENGGGQHFASCKPCKSDDSINQLRALEKEWHAKGYTPCLKNEELSEYILAYKISTYFCTAQHYGMKLADDIALNGTKNRTKLIKKISPPPRKQKK